MLTSMPSPPIAKFKPKQLIRICLFTSLSFGCTAGVNAELIEEVVVDGELDLLPVSTGDAADMLKGSGVYFSSAGGISKLPVLHGMNDDRVKLIIDGAETTSACANHMNPALSYIDASRVKVSEVIAGITPVSVGGDSIAGSIVIRSENPRYSDVAGQLLVDGYVGMFYKSGSRNNGLTLNTAVANEFASLEYSGTRDKAESYKDGNGNKVLDTLYKTESHTLTFGLRGEREELIVKASHHEVPYQGFPNQYMDMVGNVSNAVNINYLREFDWGSLDSRATWQDVSHEMGFFTPEKTGMMPMKTEGKDVGYNIAATLPLSNEHVLKLGHEYHNFTLDDWWPAVAGSMMMGPNDFININDGERSRLAFWAESNYQLTAEWKVISGIRYEHVAMNTGDVQPYSTMSSMMMQNLDAEAAIQFNSRDRKVSDDNVDITLLARYEPKQTYSLEMGYARKTRSPNLYERYSWGRNTMAMTMIGWFGNGNGYVGDIDLKPEIAHTLGMQMSWRSVQEDDWSLSLAPYFTYVDDYVDVSTIETFHPRMAMSVVRSKLAFTNSDAEFYGVDVKGQKLLWQNDRFGKGKVTTQLSYTRGQRRNSDADDLYHVMPMTLSTKLEQSVNNWVNTLELEWVAKKRHVDDLRHENTTPGYALVNLSSQVGVGAWSFSAGVRNVFDKYYAQPLGGVSIAQWAADGMQGQLEPLPGLGRSIDLGVRFKF